MRIFKVLIMMVLSFGGQAFAQQLTETTLVSPDKNLVMDFYQKKNEAGVNQMFYKVAYKNKPVILESKLDLDLDNHLTELAMALKVDKQKKWFDNLVFKSKTTAKKDTVWKPLYGERSMIKDEYNETTITFEKADNKDYQLQVQLRAYNEGVAVRYYFPENPKGSYYQITAENTEFSLPDDTKAYYTQWAQAPYYLLPLSDWPDESERPLTLQLKNGLFACLAEAQMVDYARGKFTLSKEKKNTIVTKLYGGVDGISYFATPWRVVMVAESMGKLLENNDIILNLNEASKVANTSWIKPGKIIREMTLTTEGAFKAIDFAAARNLQYVLFDWKWYGPALTWDSDATQVKAKMDMPAIVAYGKSKNVGIWLYVNQQALLKQSDEIFPLYKKWGIKGVKFGFVQTGSHRWTTWLHDSVKKAADNELMVNIHDEFRQTGEQRTYPNMMTAEGIRGNEEMPDATHNTILPFTRFISGAADYTLCYFSPRIKTTHAHQLALAAVYYSPIQTMYWYDAPSAYNNEPELEFWDKIPTSWDETKVLKDDIGKVVSVARRSGNDWFVGTITNNDARNIELKFDFLTKGKKYAAKVYSDDPQGTTKTKVKVEEIKADHTTVLKAALQASGGQAIWIRAL